MNIPSTLNFGTALDKLWTKWRQIYEQVAKAVNGNIEFGNPTSGPGNINGVWASVTTPGVANTDFTITHNLGRVCVGYPIQTADRAASIYTSPTPNAAPLTTVILRCNVASAVLTIFLI